MNREKKYILILPVLLLLPLYLFPQFVDSYCNEIDSKKAVKYFETGLKLLNSGKQNEAIDNFTKALDEDDTFTEAWLVMAEIYNHRLSQSVDSKNQKMNYSLYKRCLQKVVETCPTFDNYRVNYILGMMFFEEDDLKNAQKYLTTFVNNGDRKASEYDNAKAKLSYIGNYFELIRNPVPFQPKPLEGVCSVNDDYLPLISPDGSIAFYTHAYMKSDISTIYGDKYTEEFTAAQRIESKDIDERYSKGKAMPYPFNTGKNQGAVSISIDNSTLYITICEFVSRDYDNCDIFVAQRKGSEWSDLRSLGPNINGLYSWESQPSISADGNILYFASIRPGNVGWDERNPTSDIWFSKKDENGVWQKAENMGPTINTPGNEKSPFIHSDSQTLYFSSDGHPGLGGYDIFFSKYRNNAWSQPQNIGYPINTRDNDLGFIVSTNGQRAYFSSNKFDGYGGWDIYYIDLYEEARPEQVMFVKGQLVDEAGAALTDASVEVKNLTTKEVTQGLVDSETGHYAVAVTITEEKKDDDYLMVVKKEGYSFTSFYIENALEPEQEFIEIKTVDFEVKPIEPGIAVKINDINYAFASAELSKESMQVLDHFIEFLNDNRTVRFEIRGHTDDVGEDITNLRLSDARAKTVYNYLLKNGISASRMTYKGYGESLPLVPNNSEANRALNRRTEFFIINK